jgi:hypothetical protein
VGRLGSLVNYQVDGSSGFLGQLSVRWGGPQVGGASELQGLQYYQLGGSSEILGLWHWQLSSRRSYEILDQTLDRLLSSRRSYEILDQTLDRFNHPSCLSWWINCLCACEVGKQWL